MEALSLYAKLMNEDPVYAMYAKLQSQQYYMQPPANAAQQVSWTCFRSEIMILQPILSVPHIIFVNRTE